MSGVSVYDWLLIFVMRMENKVIPFLCFNAAKILPVVKNQHLLLCTLLIGNSLAMEVCGIPVI